MTIIGLSCGAVAIAVFTVRIIARLSTYQKKLFWDDWIMLLMVFITLPPTILAPFLAINGLGKDIWTLPFDNINNVLQFFFVGELCYLVALALNKISLLCFFLRVFPNKRLRVLWDSGKFTKDKSSIQSLMDSSSSSRHFSNANLSATCGISAAGFNIALDIVVIALPLGELAKMNMSKRKKFGVMLMFMIGVFVTVVSAVRLKYLVQFRHTQNPTYDYLAPGYWSVVELHVGIICASMPAINSLIKVHWPKLVSGTTRGGTKDSGTLHSVNSDMRFAAGTPGLKHPRVDDFELLPDVEVDAATMRTQNSRADLLPGTAL
ncbi:hypothetical protein OHC33_006526 [Knufia fluminis]|uniref:Rhodopsin domain-containing protein n=1 Tax=Knufia fluminis TaxID=191047 RepID=A0AAN8EUN0_9EURO|nr:hypothetical protein OHC33_006526 [Knufia fluminis]